MFNALRRSRVSASRAAPRTSPDPRRSARPGSPAGRGRIRRFLIRRRRLLAGLAVAAAAGITLQALLPAESVQTAAAAARDLPAGHLLTPQDLRPIRLPPEAVPPGAVSDPALAAGEMLAVPVPAGTVISRTVLVGDGLLSGAPAGSAAIPLRPADPAAAAMLSPGVLVDVVVAPAEGFDGAAEPEVLAAGVPVLWVSSGSTGSPWPGSAGGETEDQLVVVAAPGADAPGLAVASSRGQVYLVPSSR